MAVTGNFKYLNWLSAFQIKNLTPISFFLDAKESSGTNQFFIQEAFSIVKEAIENQNGGEVEPCEIEVEEVKEGKFTPPSAHVFDEIYAQDMFATTRVILLKCPSAWVKENASAIEKLILRPIENYYILINTTSVDARTKFGALIGSNCHVIEFPRMFDAPPSWGSQSAVSDNDYTRWISNRAKRYQKNISLQNAMLLLTMVGINLRSLDNKLSLLSIYVQNNQEITENNIKDLIPQPTGVSVFKVVDAIMARNFSEALGLVRRMFLYGVPVDGGKLEVDRSVIIGFYFIPMLFKRIKRILDTNNLIKRGASINDAAKEQNIPAYFIRALETDIKQFGKPRQLEVAINALVDADFKLKTSAIDPAWLAEEIVLKMLG